VSSGTLDPAQPTNQQAAPSPLIRYWVRTVRLGSVQFGISRQASPASRLSVCLSVCQSVIMTESWAKKK